jgi:hypothetical protein
MSIIIATRYSTVELLLTTDLIYPSAATWLCYVVFHAH